MNLEKTCLNSIEYRRVEAYKGITTERDMAVSRNKFLSRNAPEGFPFHYRIKKFVSPTRIRAKYDLFMFGLEDKHLNIYSKLVSFGFPKPY